MNSRLRRLFAVAALALCSSLSLHAQHPAGGRPVETSSPYAPYEVLMGDWDVMQPGQPPFMVMHFKWAGGRRGYILYNASSINNGQEETHFEGMLIWNAVNKNLDMLLTLDPTNGTTQEKGTVSIDADGTIVRTIIATGPQTVRGTDGKPTAGTANFRQTFHVTGHDEMKTVVMRETSKGWVPTFPGSDNLIMRKRPAAGHAEAAPAGHEAAKDTKPAHGH